MTDLTGNNRIMNSDHIKNLNNNLNRDIGILNEINNNHNQVSQDISDNNNNNSNRNFDLSISSIDNNIRYNLVNNVTGNDFNNISSGQDIQDERELENEGFNNNINENNNNNNNSNLHDIDMVNDISENHGNNINNNNGNDNNINENNINNNNNNNDNQNNDNNNDQNNSINEIDNRIEKFFRTRKTKDQTNQQTFHSSSYHFMFDDDNTKNNNRILTEFFKNKDIFVCGISVIIHRYDDNRFRCYFYCQLKTSFFITKNDFNFCKIRNYNKSADYIIDVLRREKIGEVLFDKGTPKRKGGLKTDQIIKMPKNKRNEIKGYYRKSCEYADHLEQLDVNRQRKIKNIKVYYIHSRFKDGSVQFLINLLLKHKINFSNVRFDKPFWSGIENNSSVAVMEYFVWQDLPVGIFQVLVGDTLQYFNVKGTTVINNFTHVYLFGTESPGSIYPNVERFDFQEFVNIIEYDDLKEDVNPESTLGLTDLI